MAKIVDYNGHHVRIGSPLDERLRKQDSQYRAAVDSGELETVGDDGATSADASDYSALKKAELVALCEGREIEVEKSDTVKTLVAKLEADDASGDGDDGATLT